MASTSLTRADIDGLARKLFKYLAEDDEQWLSRLRLNDPDERDALRARLSKYDVSGREELLRLNDVGSARELVDQLLKKENLILDDEGEYGRLCQLALRAYAEAGRQKLAKFDGNYGVEIEDKLFAAPAGAGMAVPAPSLSTLPTEVPSIGLAELIRLHVADASKDWTEQTLKQNNVTFRFLTELLGDVPASSIGKRGASEFRKALGELPAKYGQMPEYRGKTFARIREIAAKISPPPKCISLKTRDRHLSAVSGLYSWGIKHGHLECANPVTGLLDKRKAAEAAAKRRIWLPHELKALFDSSVWRGSKVERDGRFFVPLLCLYTGMRQEEACKLKVDEIQQVDGIWIMDIKNSDEGRLKEEASKRKLPIHPKLIEFGFLDHVSKMKALGQTVLWPEMKKGGADKKRGHNFSKWFGRLRDSLGLKAAPGEPELVFHSFRHTAAHALTKLGISEVIINGILGHAGKTMSTVVYGGPVSIHILHETICNIDFGVDLSHLRPR